MRREEIGRDDANRSGKAKRPDPNEIDAGHEHERAPNKRDEQRLAEIGLHNQEHREHGIERDGELDAGNVPPLLRLVEQPGGKHDESGLHELRGLD